MRRAHMSFGMQELLFTASSYTRHCLSRYTLCKARIYTMLLDQMICIHRGICDSSSGDSVVL